MTIVSPQLDGATGRIALALPEARLEHGLSQRRLAPLSGVSATTIRRIERGARVDPRPAGEARRRLRRARRLRATVLRQRRGCAAPVRVERAVGVMKGGEGFDELFERELTRPVAHVLDDSELVEGGDRS
jgi:transcriptional regulator with XRE-family HTH domain